MKKEEQKPKKEMPQPKEEMAQPEKASEPPKKKPREEVVNERKIEKAFVCPYCSMIFNRKFNRNRHVYVIHKKKSDQLAEVVAKAEEEGREKAMKEMCKPTVRVYVYYNDECVATAIQ